MLPHKHVAVSTAIGAIGWWSTGNPTALGVALLSGVLPDLDHAVDYLYYYLRGTHRLILPFHGYEYGVMGAVAAFAYGNTVMWVAVLSYLVHLLADQAENKTRVAGYFLLFRLWHRFRIEEISTMPEAAARGRMDDLQMLSNLLARVRQRYNKNRLV